LDKITYCQTQNQPKGRERIKGRGERERKEGRERKKEERERAAAALVPSLFLPKEAEGVPMSMVGCVFITCSSNSKFVELV
jgi:hypothetical protein